MAYKVTKEIEEEIEPGVWRQKFKIENPADLYDTREFDVSGGPKLDLDDQTVVYQLFTGAKPANDPAGDGE